jgi:toxin YoeB
VKLSWSDEAWEDYLYWHENNKNLFKRANTLIKDIKRHPFEGIGDPEPLRHNWTGYWSRRLNQEHRLVYKVKDDELYIAQCRYHY